MSEGRKLVRIELYNNKEKQVVVGRLIGLLSKGEFGATIKSKTLMNKLITTETKPLSNIARLADVNDLRIAMVLKRLNGEPISRKQLFFTEPLRLITTVFKDDSITIDGQSEAFMFAEEKDYSEILLEEESTNE